MKIAATICWVLTMCHTLNISFSPTWEKLASSSYRWENRISVLSNFPRSHGLGNSNLDFELRSNAKAHPFIHHAIMSSQYFRKAFKNFYSRAISYQDQYLYREHIARCYITSQCDFLEFSAKHKWEQKRGSSILLV